VPGIASLELVVLALPWELGGLRRSGIHLLSLETPKTPMYMIVDFGVIACQRSVSQVSDVVLGFGAAVAELHKISLGEAAKTPTRWLRR
jgi:hypothetical protein